MKSGYRLLQDDEQMATGDEWRIRPGEWYKVNGLSDYTVGEHKNHLCCPEAFECRRPIKTDPSKKKKS
jgi:hypothetical protein